METWWYSELNSGMEGMSVRSKSNKQAWWRCPLGHTFQQSVASKTRSPETCKICSGQLILQGINDLPTKYPSIALEWSDTKNGHGPAGIAPASQEIFWWLCPEGHFYQTSPAKRTSRGAGCKYCSGKGILTGVNDLATRRPDMLQSWSPRNKISPDSVQVGSNLKVLWVCPEGHEYSAQISNRTNIKSPTGCPYCSGQAVLEGFNDLATRNPELAAQWHPTLNGSLKSTQVSSSSTVDVWWQCQMYSDHYWRAKVYSRLGGNNCAVCANQFVISGVNDLAAEYPGLALEWDYTANKGIDPSLISSGSHAVVAWVCQEGHRWRAAVRTRAIRGHGCGYCSGRHPVKGLTDLATTHPELLAEWDWSKNKLRPDELLAGTSKKLHWKCRECSHEWVTTGNKRVSGQGCPNCSIGGFQISRASVLYFIHHPGLRAKKIGITNLEARPDRLKGFEELGWKRIFTWEFETGHVALRTEKSVLRWIREDLNLPYFLSQAEMGKPGGWTETFSEDAAPDQDIIDKINQELIKQEIV